MTLAFDIYWSFRSPYSYLSTGRIRQIGIDYDVDVNIRPVYPLAIRDAAFFDKINPLWPRYLMRDTFRAAEMYGIDYKWPQPDPVVIDRGVGGAAEDQPYIHRLTRLGIEAAEQGKGIEFLDEVSQIIWNGRTSNWHEGDHLKAATAKAGLDLEEMDKKVAADAKGYDARIDQNQQNLEAAGHWGVPTMVFEGEPFFGQDHIDVLLWRMAQKGMKKR